jgi:dihydroflavonol-4-reductase
MAATEAMARATNPDGDGAAPLVAVTGAAGHVGANLVRSLLAEGYRVRALVREHDSAIDGLPVDIVRADVLDPGTLAPALAKVDIVFHLAAKISAGWESPASVSRVNVEGTRNVVEACLAMAVRRLVHFSSVQVFAPVAGATIFDESCPLVRPADRHRGVYDHSKADADRIVLGALGRGLDPVILHPTAVLGPFDFQPSAMGQVLRALALGRVPALITQACQDFVDPRDVAAAAITAARRGGRGERYLLSGTRLALVELARLWAGVTGRRAPRLAVPMALARLAAPFAPAWARWRGRRPLFTPESLRMLRDFVPGDRGKAERELAYQPRPIEQTLRDTWAWMQKAG